MKFDVIEGDGQVRALVTKNICPYCREGTAERLGDGVVGRLASRAAEEGELVCYHCKNPGCEHMNYYVRKADFEEYGH
ncbi:hypothetical protein IBX73_03415 [candidate division WOR-3 bacterium]|nr:hypothetical protein [candidate division WOR-3 bacterium]